MIMRILSVTWFVFVIINERVWNLGANSYGNFPIWKQPLLIMSLAVPFWSLLVDDNQQIGIICFIPNNLLSSPSPSPCPNRPPRHATFWPKVSFNYIHTFMFIYLMLSVQHSPVHRTPVQDRVTLQTVQNLAQSHLSVQSPCYWAPCQGLWLVSWPHKGLWLADTLDWH